MPRPRRTTRLALAIVAWCGVALATPPPAGAAPATPTITSAPASPGRSTAPSWSFTTGSGTTAECELERDGVVVDGRSPCTSPVSYDLRAAPDGDYTFSVWAVDGSGRESKPATSTYVLDRSAPTAPVITSAPTSPGEGRTPAWSFSTVDGTSTVCSLTRGSKVVAERAPCGSPVGYDLTGQPEGTYTFSVWAVDATGGTSAAATSSYELSSGTPSAPTITSSPTSPGTTRAPEWSFTATAGSTTTCQVAEGSRIVFAFAPCTSPTVYDLTGQPDGSYTFSVRVPSTNASSRVGSTATSTYVLSTGASSPTTPPAGGTDPGTTDPGTTDPGAVTPPAPTTTPPRTTADPGAGTPPATATNPGPDPAAGTPPGDGNRAADQGRFGPPTPQPAGTAPVLDLGAGSSTTNSTGPTTGGPVPAGEGGSGRPGPARPVSEGSAVEPPVQAVAEPAAGEAGAADAARRFGEAALAKSPFPILLVGLVLLFLAVQDRLDRRDPKLALAPVYAQPHLSFDDPPDGPA